MVSVIIPVYNVENYIGRCVDSVRNQTCRDLEIILVDDGSKDASGALCDSYARSDGRIRVIHQKNGGPSAARNAGLQLAKGEYVGFVDGDDWIKPDYYEHLSRIAKARRADIVSGLYQRTGNIPNPGFGFFREKITALEGDGMLENFLASAIKGGVTQVPCWSKLYRRDVLKGFFFDEEISYCEDLIFNWKVLNSVRNYVCTNYAGYYYFSNEESLTKKKGSEIFLELCDAADRIDKIYQSGHKKICLLIKQYRIKADYSALIRMTRSGGEDLALARKLVRNVKQECACLLISPLSAARKTVLLLIKALPQEILLKMMLDAGDQS